MPEWLGFVLFIAAYVLFFKLLVPRFGARRCPLGACHRDAEPAKNSKSPATN
jgi:hypothetical protein